MACLDLDRLRTHPLGHEALKVGIDRSVLGGHGIEGRLGAPCSIRRLFGRQRLLERLLNRVEDACLLRRQVAREVVQKSRLRALRRDIRGCWNDRKKNAPARAGA